jgi:hypothetical protein
VYVSLPRATCLLGVDATGVIVAAPPKARRTLGTPVARIEEYAERHPSTTVLIELRSS